MNRKLNNKQINNLKTILKFRYVTANNLAQYLGITHNSAYSTLEILCTNGYIGKIHNKNYRLLNKSAQYYLTLQSIKFLRDEVGVKLENTTWNSRKSDCNKGDDFIDLQVAVHSAYNKLKGLYGNKVDILTALDLHGTEGIIKPLPGLLVKTESGNQSFIEMTGNQHLFIVKKRIRKYIENYEAGEWGWDKYPNVYIVRDSPSDRTRLRKYVEQQMEDCYLDDSDFSFNIISRVERIKLA